jgi:NAD(P)-dependent dehydrogenase (short-subunit alcohol dehydrogenase family)
MATVLIIGASKGIGLATVRTATPSRSFGPRAFAVRDGDPLARSQA